MKIAGTMIEIATAAVIIRERLMAGGVTHWPVQMWISNLPV